MTNTVTLVGNATRPAELRYTTAGTATAVFGIAVNRRWQNRQTNEWEEAVSYFNVVCWHDLAQNVAESVDKGTRVVVTGRLDQRSWETKEGEKRSVVEITAEDVGLSLKFATGTVSRNERRGPGVNTPPPAAAAYDEEPF